MYFDSNICYLSEYFPIIFTFIIISNNKQLKTIHDDFDYINSFHCFYLHFQKTNDAYLSNFIIHYSGCINFINILLVTILIFFCSIPTFLLLSLASYSFQLIILPISFNSISIFYLKGYSRIFLILLLLIILFLSFNSFTHDLIILHLSLLIFILFVVYFLNDSKLENLERYFFLKDESEWIDLIIKYFNGLMTHIEY